MGCAGSKTKAKQKRSTAAKASGGPSASETANCDSLEPIGDRVNELLRPVSRVDTGECADDRDPQSTGRSSNAMPEEELDLFSTAADSASDNRERASEPTADAEVKLQLGDYASDGTDGISKSLGLVTQSSAVSAPASPQPQLGEGEEANAGSLIPLAMEAEAEAEVDADAEAEVELSPPCDAEAKQVATAEDVPQSGSKRESSHSPLLPGVQQLPRVRASVSSNTSDSSHHPVPRKDQLAASAASDPCRHSRKASIADSLSFTEQPSRWSAQRQAQHPSVPNASSPQARQHRDSLEAAAPPQHIARRENCRDAAVAPLYPGAFSSASAAPGMQEALAPAGQLSDRQAARQLRAASDCEATSSLLDMKPSRYRESPVDQSTPHSQQPLQPTPAPWRRGFTSPIPYRQGYTNPAPGAGPLTHRPLTTYLPPPTAYIIGAAGSAPPRLLLHPSALAAVEASTTKLLQSQTLRLAGAPAGAAAMRGSGRESEVSASTSLRFAASWMSAPLAARESTPRAGPSVYQEPTKMPPLSAADSSHSRSSQQRRYAAAASQAQQQRQQRYSEESPPSEHRESSRSSMQAGAAAYRAVNHTDLGVEATSVDSSYAMEQELGVYEQQYCNAQEPREDSVATYEPSTTDEAPTNTAVLLPAGHDARSSSMLRYPWHGGSDTGED